MHRIEKKNKYSNGFTLIEMMVAVGIVAVLATIVTAGVSEARKKVRDNQRIVDLENIALALEVYKEENGEYPKTGAGSACNGTGGTPTWDGHGSSYGNCDEYIEGIIPGILPALPQDPNKDTAGYVYRSDGAQYKLVANRTVESETIDANHDYFRCDASCNTGTFAWCAVGHVESEATYSIWSDPDTGSNGGAECW